MQRHGSLGAGCQILEHGVGIRRIVHDSLHKIGQLIGISNIALHGLDVDSLGAQDAGNHLLHHLDAIVVLAGLLAEPNGTAVGIQNDNIQLLELGFILIDHSSGARDVALLETKQLIILLKPSHMLFGAAGELSEEVDDRTKHLLDLGPNLLGQAGSLAGSVRSYALHAVKAGSLLEVVIQYIGGLLDQVGILRHVLLVGHVDVHQIDLGGLFHHLIILLGITEVIASKDQIIIGLNHCKSPHEKI